MPAFVRYSVDKPHVALVPHGRHERVVIIAAAPRPVYALYLSLSGYALRILVSLAAPPAVTCRCPRRYRLGYGGSVIVILLCFCQ